MKAGWHNLTITRIVLLLVLACSLVLLSLTSSQQAASASVTLTEFADFQCPYCKQAANVVRQVRQAYGERVKVVFKQMPLPMHQHAFKAAQASVCAQQQGKFWEYHDRLFASDDLSVDVLNQIAAKVGLKQEEFNQCLDSASSRTAVEKDIAEADRLGVSGTPTFFVDGTFEGAATFDSLKEEIDKELIKLHHPMLKSLSQKDDPLFAHNLGADRRIQPNHVPAGENLRAEAALSPTRFTTNAIKEQQQASSTTTAAGVTLSPAAINFGYQLVGTAGPQMTETVTNSSTALLVITDISVSGRDRGNFKPTYSFSLPVTVGAGQTIAINLSFTPALPWRPGTRNATLEISEQKTSQYLSLTGIGATCDGPLPACSSGCPDTDHDGLNDAWEIAGGIDMNNDGVIDGTNDLILRDADPNKPDIFVHYDWMDYGAPGNACAVDSDCTGLGLGHKGETCSGPQLIPTAPGSCRYACTVDADCTSRGPGHTQEICSANSCVHTHDPLATAPNALQAVVDRFATHGINLHLIRGKPQPHSTVISFRLLTDPQFTDNVMTDTCEGGSLSSGSAGTGKYAESFYDLKANSSPDKLNIAYHYMIFAHYSGCDTSAHCNLCSPALNPNGSVKNSVVAGESGLAEISGNDFIVSLGSHVNDFGIPENTLIAGGTFMHELGHNLGLHHGGGIDTPCQDDSQCPAGVSCIPVGTPLIGKFCVGSDDITWKPNYLSVMNYRFQFTGIPFGNFPGDPNVAGTRLDYSSQTLPTGGNTPGALEERNTNGFPGLSEPAGLGSGTADLTSYLQYDPGGPDRPASCIFPAVLAPTDGPIDFNGDGTATDINATADLNGIDHPCGTVFTRLTGATDWPEFSGVNFTYGFQCTAYGGPSGDGAQGGSDLKSISRVASSNVTGELSPQMAMDAHVLFPMRSVKIIIGPGLNNPIIAAGLPGVVQIALLGESTFDVSQVDPTSLDFHGSKAINFSVQDINGDGRLDLVATFDTSTLKLHRQPTVARLTGWLNSSQAFIGQDYITAAPY